MKKNIIRISNLHYEDILKNASLEITKDSISTLTGKSGSGKSSLFRCINRLENSYQGDIYLLEKNTSEIPVQKLRQSILYLFQEPYLFTDTIYQELLWPLQNTNENQKKTLPDKETLTRHLRNLDLNFDLNQPTGKLSGGEKQRLCLLKAFLSRPDLLLLDEPSSALNPDLALHSIRYLLENFSGTVFMITHQKELLALADNHYTLKNKTIYKE